jgi:DNA-directed RNA polymerase specialized sigma24 family protein
MPYQWDGNSVRSVVERHQQKIFALIMYLIGGDKNKTYTIASGAFSGTLRVASPLDTDSALLTKLARSAVERCRDVKTIPSFDDSDFKGLPAEKMGSLRMVRTSLQLLPFESRALLLLRDQIHLSYKQISSVLGGSENEARIQTIEARAKLRKAVEEIIAHGR